MGAMPPSAILSRKGIARYGGGISHWAAKEANFFEVCFGMVPYGNLHTKATFKKSILPSGNFRQNPPPPELRRSPSNLGIGNGVGKQGRDNQPPLSTIRTRYGNSVSTPGATRTGKNKQNSLRKGSRIRNVSIDPTSSIRTPIADAIFADAIAETPIQELFQSGGWLEHCLSFANEIAKISFSLWKVIAHGRLRNKFGTNAPLA